MRTLKIFSIAVISWFAGSLAAEAQGVVVYKKDGTKEVFPYEEVDSIVTYTAESPEEQKPEEGETPEKGEPIRTFKVRGVTFSMIRVDGGTFRMGAMERDSTAWAQEYPAHNVTLSDYYIGETEVTQGLWKAVMNEANPSYLQKGDNYPVENMRWSECITFITKLNEITGENFRLPTEAEWEFAARGGLKSRGCLYSGSDNADEVAWHGGNSLKTVHEVKTKSPNELRLYDMSGNVWEWCHDYHGLYSGEDAVNPTGPEFDPAHTNHSIRGGAWEGMTTETRVTYRFCGLMASRTIGLRLAM